MERSASNSIRLVDPAEIDRNPENPRLIFRQDELDSLQESISEQGILVPLTVYQGESRYVILDGERRWRCALKLGLSAVPAIVQPEPDPITNIMMMFAIHKTRNDWDPLPTAIKLGKLERALEDKFKREPTEAEVATAASLSRGEVRRYRNISALPLKYRTILLAELEKARPLQILTVDHVLEAVRGANALNGQEVLNRNEASALTDALVTKFQTGVLKSTVDPRKLARISRAVGRGEVTREAAREISLKLTTDPQYTVTEAFEALVERADFEHGTEQLAERVINRLSEHIDRSYKLGETLELKLERLQNIIMQVLRDAGR